jgi:hypothetical protein
MFDFICTTTSCWEATGAMMSGWAAIGGVGAVLFAAHKAANTFTQYRRQRQEDRRIEAAERILTIAYSLRRRLKGVRRLISLRGEVEKAVERLKEADWYLRADEDQRNRAEIGQVVLERLQRQADAWEEIFVAMPMARALFGEPIEEAMQSIFKQSRTVQLAASRYQSAKVSGPEGRTLLESLEATFWEPAPGEPDTVSIAMDQAISALETELLPVIRAD